MDQQRSDYILMKVDESRASYAYVYTDKSARGEIIPDVHGETRRPDAAARPTYIRRTGTSSRTAANVR